MADAPCIDWVHPAHHPPGHVRTLNDLLRYRAETDPDLRLFTHLEDGEEQQVHLTAGEVWDRARAIAARLQQLGAAGARVLVIYPPGLDYVPALYGCFLAQAIAVPAGPPDPRRLERTVPRLQAISDDADVSFVLSLAPLVAVRSQMPATLAAATWIATETLDPALAASWQPPVDVDADDVAYLQYTSGSTAAPKGVVISHRNLLQNCLELNEAYDLRPESVMVSWVPTFHDLGLVYGVAMPVFIGFRCVSFSPVHFLARPIRWMRALSRYGGTHSVAPNFAFDLSVAKTRPEDRQGLDLSRWIVALNGAEPIRRESEERFAEAFAPHGFHREAISHSFGMSEATAKVTAEHAGERMIFAELDARALEQNRVVDATAASDDVRVVASCGVTAGDCEAVVVVPETGEKLGDDRLGEVWIRGTTVARGYWNNPEATERTFGARLAGSDTGPWMRTGDLGFLRGRHVFIAGRLKDMIIIRGENHYPQDLEWTIQGRHEALRPSCAAAFSVQTAAGEQLVLVTEVYPDRLRDAEEVFSAVREAVAEHGLHVTAILLTGPRSVPKTSSGKIQRSKVKHLFLEGRLTPLARWDHGPTADALIDDSSIAAQLETAPASRRRTLLDAHLRGLVATQLGLDADDIAVDRPLSELGLDSVDAVELVERLGRSLGLTLGSSTVFDYPTVADLVSHLLEGGHAPAAVAGGPAVDTKAIAAMTEDEVAEALLRELEDL